MKIININSSQNAQSTIIILGIEITTILVLLGIAHYIGNTANKPKNNNGIYPSSDLHHWHGYFFIAVLLGIIIIHNLVIGGWHHPKDIVFIGILVVIGVWVFCKFDKHSSEPFTNQGSGKHKLQPLGQNDIDYNLPEAGRDNSSPDIVGTDLVDAHPELDTNELVWGNRPEHYDYTPDDIPAYLELESLRQLKTLKKKVKRDKNYKYLAEIKPYDSQSSHRPESDDKTLSGQGLLLHRQHGLDNIFLEHADKHKAYGMPKEVLDVLSNSIYGSEISVPQHWADNQARTVWKEGRDKSKNVKGSGKYKRNNGVPGSKYKFLNEPEPTLVPNMDGIVCAAQATTTTRPDNLNTSPGTGTGPVIQIPEIRDEMLDANSKFRTAEYFTGFTASSSNDSNQYSLYSDAINQRLPGCSDKISQYATNYPLVSRQSLEKISDNCARRLDGSCLTEN